jgi:hypothetical protein
MAVAGGVPVPFVDDDPVGVEFTPGFLAFPGIVAQPDALALLDSQAELGDKFVLDQDRRREV